MCIDCAHVNTCVIYTHMYCECALSIFVHLYWSEVFKVKSGPYQAPIKCWLLSSLIDLITHISKCMQGPTL